MDNRSLSAYQAQHLHEVPGGERSLGVIVADTPPVTTVPNFIIRPVLRV